MNRLGSYAQLVRLPNLPTAIADIALAALATGSLPERWPGFLLLVAASSCLYMAGMVWNDFFDIEQDKRERPDRPLASGRVSRHTAGLLGATLMILGVGFAMLVNLSRSGVIAGALVIAIFLYDGWLKRTAMGPIAMGLCRFLNVLLGVSLSDSLWPLGPHLATVVGLYIVGVTWFARTEAKTSSQTALAGAACVMLASLLLGLTVASQKPVDTVSPLFPFLLVALGFWLGFPLYRAINSPTPTNVQSGVKRSLIGLILLDAALASGTAGTIGLILLVLLLPSLYLNRRRTLYAT
jgi:4-hydroxybenzoate polyprenyltransferase